MLTLIISPVSVPTIPTTLAPMLAAVSDVAITHKHTVSQKVQKIIHKSSEEKSAECRRKIRNNLHLNIRYKLELNL